MPHGSIYRATQVHTATLAAGATLSPALDVAGFAGGLLEIPSGWDATSTLYFKVKPGGQDGWLDLYDKDGSRVSVASPSANRSLELPAQVLMADQVKVITNTANTPSTAGALVLAVKLKG